MHRTPRPPCQTVCADATIDRNPSFLTQYAPLWLRRPGAALVDLLAAVPSIVYGLWGLITFGPFFKPIETWLANILGWIPISASTGPIFASTGITGGTILFIGVVLSIMVDDTARIFGNPTQQQTEDYISGRFG